LFEIFPILFDSVLLPVAPQQVEQQDKILTHSHSNSMKSAKICAIGDCLIAYPFPWRFSILCLALIGIDAKGSEITVSMCHVQMT
jgi:hypothetical protein